MPEYIETTIDKFIFRIATDRLYSVEGVWVFALNSEGSRVRVGVTDYLQQRNGDVAFAHMKPGDTKLVAGDEIAELETVKANVSLFSPVSGTIVKINADLEQTPEVINDQPYDRGWLAEIETSAWATDRSKLLDPQAYLAEMKTQAEKELNGQ